MFTDFNRSLFCNWTNVVGLSCIILLKDLTCVRHLRIIAKIFIAFKNSYQDLVDSGCTKVKELYLKIR